MLRTFILSTLALSLAFAQRPRDMNGNPPPGDPLERRIEMLTNMLSLTTTQQEQAKTIYSAAATAGTALRTNMETAREALDTAVKANNAAGIDQAASAIGSLTAQSTSINAKADAAFYLILTPDQQTKWSQFGPMRGPGGPGMMGGPGGPGMMGGRGRTW
jgi:Spy/CpxP family protein refolding chaperone